MNTTVSDDSNVGTPIPTNNIDHSSEWIVGIVIGILILTFFVLFLKPASQKFSNPLPVEGTAPLAEGNREDEQAYDSDTAAPVVLDPQQNVTNHSMHFGNHGSMMTTLNQQITRLGQEVALVSIGESTMTLLSDTIEEPPEEYYSRFLKPHSRILKRSDFLDDEDQISSGIRLSRQAKQQQQTSHKAFTKFKRLTSQLKRIDVDDWSVVDDTTDASFSESSNDLVYNDGEGEDDTTYSPCSRLLRLPVFDPEDSSSVTYRTVDGTCSICLKNYKTNDTVCWSTSSSAAIYHENANKNRNKTSCSSRSCTSSSESLLLSSMTAPLPYCPHVFHKDCIVMWLSRDKTCCPTCRQDFVPAGMDVNAHDRRVSVQDYYVASILQQQEQQEQEQQEQHLQEQQLQVSDPEQGISLSTGSIITGNETQQPLVQYDDSSESAYLIDVDELESWV